METEFVFVLAEEGGVEFELAAAGEIEGAFWWSLACSTAGEKVLKGGCWERFEGLAGGR